MAKARTTAATTVEEPIVEQNVETTSVVEEPQTVSEEGNGETTTEGNGENTSQTPVEGDNNETTTEGTPEDENPTQTPTDEGNGETTTEPSLEDKFVKMSGINKPYADGIMNLPNFDYYIPVGSGVNLTERNKLIACINEAKNKPTEGE